MTKEDVSVFWFRRDLRLEDNIGLYHALKSSNQVIPLFIFDEDILDDLPKNDARVTFIYESLYRIHKELKTHNSSLLLRNGIVKDVWQDLVEQFNIKAVYFNKDYEPYGIKRDQNIITFLNSKGIPTFTFKDQVIFEENDILKADTQPYTVYTPYKNKWLQKLQLTDYNSILYDPSLLINFHQFDIEFPSLEHIGFIKSTQKVQPYKLEVIDDYDLYRDLPGIDKTSYLSPHLRFGTVSIRKLVSIALLKNQSFLSELIWREFFMQILFHFPKVVTNNFKRNYDGIEWRDNITEFKKWCEGNTGYPLVDAGMRQLNETGYMHNRVRMVVAGFLCKHLLIDWRLGEAYFANKLLDYELSSNNGNWQWAAGTGCDAAPYFRVFNPIIQLEKFDKNLEYVKKWIPELDTTYCKQIVDHKFARDRAIETYKKGILRKLNPM